MRSRRRRWARAPPLAKGCQLPRRVAGLTPGGPAARIPAAPGRDRYASTSSTRGRDGRGSTKRLPGTRPVAASPPSQLGSEHLTSPGVPTATQSMPRRASPQLQEKLEFRSARPKGSRRVARGSARRVSMAPLPRYSHTMCVALYKRSCRRSLVPEFPRSGRMAQVSPCYFDRLGPPLGR